MAIFRRGGDDAKGGEGSDAGSSGGPWQLVDRSPRERLGYMEGVAPLESMHVRERAALAEVAEIVRCHGGAVIYEGGDEGKFLYLIIQGGVHLRVSLGQNRWHVAHHLGPGAFIGLDAALTGSPYHLQAIATERTAAFRIKRDTIYAQLREGRPAMAKLYVKMGDALGELIRESTWQVLEMLGAPQGGEVGAPRGSFNAAFSSQELRRVMTGDQDI